jgi:protease-4
MSFLKSFLASCLGAFTAMVLLLVFVFVMISLSGGDEVIVKKGSILFLDLDAPIVETEKEEPFTALFLIGASSPKTIGLAQLLGAIKHASTDENIEGIRMAISYPMAGYAMLAEVRSALEAFREKGKWVVSYSEVMTEGAYYLASVADKVYLNPEGEVEFNGLSVEVSFFKRLFDKLDIKPEVFRVGEFKSAVEPFMLERMSDANRTQLAALIDDIYDGILASVAKSRGLDKERLRDISTRMLVRNAQQSVENGLIDSLFYEDQVERELKHRLSVAEGEDLTYIDYEKYKRSFSTYNKTPNEIAVLVAEGTIMPGKADQGQLIIGSETFTAQLRKLRENNKVKGIVIRINSPGGSSLASDIIWREIRLTSAVKPVIASMSDYAASGGYYLAIGCDTIVAQPSTVTGSIGVFTVLYDASGFLGNKIGITSDEVRTGEIGDLITFSRPLTEVEKSIWQKRTEEVYNSFTTKAAMGRGMELDDLLKVASGRVWSGRQARENGLVDVLGGLSEAILVAARAAGVEDEFGVKTYPQYSPTFLEQLIDQLDENQQSKVMKSQVGEYYDILDQVRRIKSLSGTQARLPYELRIR